MTRVALAHDYLTQRGGAERVVLSLAKAFPGAPLYTSLYDPASTFPEFASLDVRPLWPNGIGPLRRHHRLALPLLAPAFSTTDVDADVAVCSSSGWSHGLGTPARKLVYCHNPARWLYQSDLYLRHGGRAARVLLGPLARWDKRAAREADRYLVNSQAVRDRVRRVYGIDARVVPPPPRLTPKGASQAVVGLEPGFILSVARLLPYKNVDAAIDAVRGSKLELVVVGSGPEERRLRAAAPANVRLLGSVSDAEMRWLYTSCSALLAVSYEDYGLTPLEAASFGKPTVALRFGGYLDTVLEGETGVFVETPAAVAIAAGIEELTRRSWDRELVRSHAARFTEERFIETVRAEVEELAR
jgi:glycosyltransferase involved in cell wall biosynthesis